MHTRPSQMPRDIPIRTQRAIPALASISSPYTHNLGNGAPTTFKRPSYLRFSFLRDSLQTDVDTAFSIQRPVVPPLVTGGRDVTPFTESDDDSESSTGFSRRPYAHRERGRARERRSAYQGSLPSAGLEPAINLPTRWNEQDRNKYLHVSEDGRNLSFHGETWFPGKSSLVFNEGKLGPNSQGEREAAAARANHPIPPACGIYYYEVTILDKGFKG